MVRTLLKKDYSIFDVENPPKNPDSYLKLRKNLINKAKKFTSYINEDYYAYDFERQNLKNKLLISRTYDESKAYMSTVNHINRKNIKKIKSQENKINALEKRIEELESKNKDKNCFLKFLKI